MAYSSFRAAVNDLEKQGELIRVTQQIDPYLEMAAIQRHVYAQKGPAVLFEKVKGSPFQAVSNVYGSLDRCHFLFRDSIEMVKRMVRLKSDPAAALKMPFKVPGLALAGLTALPKKINGGPVTKSTCRISDLPQIVCWPDDGGPFITLPQVYSEDPDARAAMSSNLGMYRIQLGGNEYIPDKEIGLHYQIHRGIGVHQSKWNKIGEPLPVSIFVGGPPSHTLAAVMPLPEGLSELTFAGALGGRRFRHTKREGFTLSAEADFVITGLVYPKSTKPEGPFGDHLGYYSLVHDFPVMEVKNVWHRKDAIWPFTVVGRPPQEDTAFGALIHELTGDAVRDELPGIREIHAVDDAGVHPLLLAIGSERYTPYTETLAPSELLTQANHIFGTGQLSLAKYLIIAADQDNPPELNDIPKFFSHVLERIDLKRDLHFQTKTSIDTLDYSGDGLNTGSKVVFAALGKAIRTLNKTKPELAPSDFINAIKFIAPGILAVSATKYTSHATAKKEIEKWAALQLGKLSGYPLVIICDSAEFVAATFSNFLWVTFTRSNPSHDIYGVDQTYENKHWGCKESILIDARIKPHHAPPLIPDPKVEQNIEPIVDQILKEYKK
ncbi:MAG: 4-hydroxy-3-polyprenylbenzoate decarboxylase [Limisphaerales bacterium]|jgi:4-hydroxy-3-polyprenylbenzoate decarboxylase